MGLFARGQAMLVRHMSAAAGVPVVYARGGRRCSPTAWVGDESYDRLQPTADGAYRVDREGRDYLIPAAELVLVGRRELPAAGDTVTETFPDGRVEVFEVWEGAGEPAYRWADRQRTLLRVHTRPLGEGRP